MKTLLTLVAVLVAWCCPGAEADRRGAEVVVVYNTAVAESKSVADHYAKSRNVPAEQVLGMKMPDRETISRQEYREFIEQPLRKEIEQRKWIEFASEIQRASAAAPGTIVKRPVHATIRYLVLCYGVPLKIAPDSSITERLPEGTKPEFRRNEAAVDNELCLLPRDPKLQQLSGILPNPFAGVSNSTWLNPTNGLLLVARVDGPSPAVARGLVDKALFAEQHGLWGRGYFDARGALDTNYAIGDVWIQGAAAIAKQVGFETILDTNSATFPASFPMSHIALYMGWYDTSVSGPFTLPRVEFMPGAFAYHLYSYSAPTLRGTQHWVTTLLDKGATCTFGYVDEPYLQGTVNLAAFLGLWIRGLTFGEAAYGAMSVLSWQTTVIGDPLYRPFGKDAAELHKELLSHKSPLVEWSVLRAINQNILAGDPKAKFIIMLERDPVTRSSAVLQEKLAEFYQADNQFIDAADTYLAAWKLSRSPMQRLRIALELQRTLTLLGREAKAVELLEALLRENPDYPDKADIYRRLIPMLRKLGKNPEADRYQSEMDRLSPPPPAPKPAAEANKP